MNATSSAATSSSWPPAAGRSRSSDLLDSSSRARPSSTSRSTDRCRRSTTARARARRMYSLRDPRARAEGRAHRRPRRKIPTTSASPTALVDVDVEWVRDVPEADPARSARTRASTRRRADQSFRPRAARARRRRLGLLRPRVQVRARGRGASGRARHGGNLPLMPFYQRLGDVPRKRHMQFRDNGTLLTEEVMGLEGFSGNGVDPLPPDVALPRAEARRLRADRARRGVPDAHAHRHFTTWDIEPDGDPITGRKLLMWNNDVEISLVPRASAWTTSSATARATRSTSSTRARHARDDVRRPAVQGGRLHRHPARHDVPFRPDSLPERHLLFETPGLIEIPKRYRNHYGQLMEGAPYYHRDIHPPTELKTIRERGEFLGQGARARRLPGLRRRLPPVRRRRLGRLPLPVDVLDPRLRADHRADPQAAALAPDVPGPNFVICSFCPRKLDFDPMAMPIPYHHSNLQSEEMIYYVDGNFSSRKGIEVGSITLHPSGLPHGPAAGAGREVDRDDGDARAGRDVRHVPPAEAHEDRQRSSTTGSTPTVVRERRAGGRRRRESRRSHLHL